MVQKLIMAELFKKHSLWGAKISITGIDGCIHKNADDDCDADSESDDEGKDDGINSEKLQNVTCFNEDTSIHDSVQVSEDLKSMLSTTLLIVLYNRRCINSKRSFTNNYLPQLYQRIGKLKNQMTISKERN